MQRWWKTGFVEVRNPAENTARTGELEETGGRQKPRRERRENRRTRAECSREFSVAASPSRTLSLQFKDQHCFPRAAAPPCDGINSHVQHKGLESLYFISCCLIRQLAITCYAFVPCHISVIARVCIYASNIFVCVCVTRINSKHTLINIDARRKYRSSRTGNACR